MNIGQVSKILGLNSKMIRYFESLGLLEDIQRTQSGYRVYDEHDLRTLQFIQHCRELDFSYEDIAVLLKLWKNQERSSREVKQLAETHIHALKAKIKRLERMVNLLQESVDVCPNNEASECSILNQLENLQLK